MTPDRKSEYKASSGRRDPLGKRMPYWAKPFVGALPGDDFISVVAAKRAIRRFTRFHAAGNDVSRRAKHIMQRAWEAKAWLEHADA